MSEIDRAAVRNSAEQMVAEAAEQWTQQEAEAAVVEPRGTLRSGINQDQQAPVNPVAPAPW